MKLYNTRVSMKTRLFSYLMIVLWPLSCTFIAGTKMDSPGGGYKGEITGTVEVGDRRMLLNLYGG